MVDQVLADYHRSPITDKEKALLAFVDRVNSAAADIRREHVDSAKKAGWTEEALYDAITVCGLFNFYNRWCDAAGVHPLPDEAYKAGAKQMAARGYTHEL